jgi:hypothetical protein
MWFRTPAAVTGAARVHEGDLRSAICRSRGGGELGIADPVGQRAFGVTVL